MSLREARRACSLTASVARGAAAPSDLVRHGPSPARPMQTRRPEAVQERPPLHSRQSETLPPNLSCSTPHANKVARARARAGLRRADRVRGRAQDQGVLLPARRGERPRLRSLAPRGETSSHACRAVPPQGYSGGALKHGPFALISDEGEAPTPIVLIILDDEHATNMRTVGEEVKARNAQVRARASVRCSACARRRRSRAPRTGRSPSSPTIRSWLEASTTTRSSFLATDRLPR